MINLPSGTRIWLVAGVTDMRKSFNGLEELVQHVFDDNLFSGHLFIFREPRGDMVKILWVDADGLCLFTKRLEDGQFLWSTVRDGKVGMTHSQAEVINRHPERERFIRAPSDAKRQVLTAMVVRRRQLIAMLVVERNRLHLTHPQSKKSINTIIKALEDELSRIDDDMNSHIRNHFKDLAAATE